MSRTLIAALRQVLADGDRIFGKGRLEESDEALYADMNGRFHALIVREAGSAMIEQAIDRNGRIPFTGPQALAFDRTSLDYMHQRLTYSPRQHHYIVDALENGEGSRVEALMREHVNPVKESLNLSGLQGAHRSASAALSRVR